LPQSSPTLAVIVVMRNKAAMLPHLFFQAPEQTLRIDLLPFFLLINDIIKTLSCAERRSLRQDAGNCLKVVI
jgi:hypothetical protein